MPTPWSSSGARRARGGRRVAPPSPPLFFTPALPISECRCEAPRRHASAPLPPPSRLQLTRPPPGVGGGPEGGGRKSFSNSRRSASLLLCSPCSGLPIPLPADRASSGHRPGSGSRTASPGSAHRKPAGLPHCDDDSAEPPHGAARTSAEPDSSFPFQSLACRSCPLQSMRRPSFSPLRLCAALSDSSGGRPRSPSTSALNFSRASGLVSRRGGGPRGGRVAWGAPRQP